MAVMVAAITVKEDICSLFQVIFLGFVQKCTVGFSVKFQVEALGRSSTASSSSGWFYLFLCPGHETIRLQGVNQLILPAFTLITYDQEGAKGNKSPGPRLLSLLSVLAGCGQSVVLHASSMESRP